MKKILFVIIASFFIFSRLLNNTFADDGYIVNMLNLNSQNEENNINLANLDNIQFYNADYSNKYNQLKNIDKVFKKEFIKKYKNGEYSYYQINGIISNYKNFIYYTNKYFYFLKIKKQNQNYREIDQAISNSIINMKNYLNRVKNIVKG
ncbi:MAG: hypothetical protein PHS49_04565 [Candidatus Gracilibacteria bacterium]|nr:hypothetical protein [Candidatus Gracilibacteria bacterium]